MEVFQPQMVEQKNEDISSINSSFSRRRLFSYQNILKERDISDDCQSKISVLAL
jgi:hypothetical protein